MTLLTVLTILLILGLVAVLVVYLVRIDHALEGIGGTRINRPMAPLASARWGVRAIERQTAAIELVEPLNGELVDLDAELRALERHLGDLVGALRRQGGGR